MAGALEAPLLRAAMGRRRAGPGFGMVAAGHQTFQRGAEVYLCWIWLVSFFCGAGRSGRVHVGRVGPEKAAMHKDV